MCTSKQELVFEVSLDSILRILVHPNNRFGISSISNAGQIWYRYSIQFQGLNIYIQTDPKLFFNKALPTNNILKLVAHLPEMDNLSFVKH